MSKIETISIEQAFVYELGSSNVLLFLFCSIGLENFYTKYLINKVRKKYSRYSYFKTRYLKKEQSNV